MTQPADKRFVMEDKLTTELALKAPIADPTFTGTVTTGNVSIGSSTITATSGGLTSSTGTVSASKLRATSTAASTGSDAAIITGNPAGAHIGISQAGISAMSDATTNSTLTLQGGGGDLSIGDSTTTVTVNGELTARGYRLVSTTLNVTPGATSFTKASYPWLRAVRVICLGGGGGGGGAALTGAAQNSIGQSGAGGAYAETFITNIAGLAATETMTVGAGGTAGGAGGAGGTGGDTSFGTLCIAKGGSAGAAGTSVAVGSFAVGISAVAAASSTGDIVFAGGASGPRQYAYNASAVRPAPGGNFFFSQPLTGAAVTTTGSAGVSPGTGIYGVGGYAGMNTQSQAAAVAGGAGAGGLMIVELYA